MLAKILTNASVGGVLVASVATNQAVAHGLPSPTEPQAVGWFALTALAVIAGLNQLFDFYKKHIKEQPSPSGTYLTKADFDKAERERKEDRAEIKKDLGDIKDALEASKQYQARARQRIHKRQNALENALSYMAGLFESLGMKNAAHFVRQKIDAGSTGGDDDDS